jgi:tetratricopeptide (TPR) repeat protein
MPPTRILHRSLLLSVAIILFQGSAQASELNLPPEATEGIHMMFSGKTDEAMAIFRRAQQDRPEHPLGYLLEAEAIWWKIYCQSMERKYNTLDAWSHRRGPDDDTYLALVDKVTRLAEASIAKHDTAEMELYAGVGYMQRSRLTGLRAERGITVRAGVAARSHMLRCLELDPNMADAYTGLGLYNYYADTLSGIAKVMRFFMGIPGGDKHVGLQQLDTAMAKAELTPVIARYFTAKNVRNFDLDYVRATELMAPLTKEYPENPVFLLFASDVAAKLGDYDEAAMWLHAAADAPEEDPACGARVQLLVRQSLAALPPGLEKQ